MCVCMCVSVCVCAQSGVRRGIFLTDMHFVEVNYKWGTFLSFFVFIFLFYLGELQVGDVLLSVDSTPTVSLSPEEVRLPPCLSSSVAKP